MKIQYLKEFLTIVDLSSFSKAAKQLFISEPPLSRHVLMLEKELGVKLLNRTTHYVELTEAGQTLLPFIRNIVTTYDAMLVKSNLFYEGIKETAVIGFLIHSKAVYHQPVLDALRKHYPDLLLRIKYSQPKQLFDAINNYSIDIGMLPLSDYPPLQKLKVIPYLKIGYTAVVSVHHPLYEKPFLTIEDLKNERYVFVSEDPLVSYAHHQSLAKCGIEPKEELFSLDFDTVPDTVAKTRYISIQSELVEPIPYSGIRYIPIKNKELFFEMGFCYSPDNENPSIKLIENVLMRFTHK